MSLSSVRMLSHQWRTYSHVFFVLRYQIIVRARPPMEKKTAPAPICNR